LKKRKGLVVIAMREERKVSISNRGPKTILKKGKHKN
jgi:hypothetical protein